MNEKIRNHINVIFAAAPRTAKAAEMKEELLINLNDKYEDLLKSGYDSTSAFHIALSGIGDIDELFQAYRDSDVTMIQAEPVSLEENASVNVTSSKISPLLFAIAALLILVPVASAGVAKRDNFLVLLSHGACMATGVGLLAYCIAKSVQNSSNASSFPIDPVTLPGEIPLQPSEISNKRIAAGILAIILGPLGVHKFYLGFTGTGLIMLLVTVLSIFILSPVTGIIGLIEGIIYLAKSDREFYRDYIARKRTWF